MRELTKSMIRFSWAMSLFGIKQMSSLLRKPNPDLPISPASSALDSITAAAERKLGNGYHAAFRAGDHLQRGLVDAAASVLTAESFEPSRAARIAQDGLRKSAEAVREAVSGGSGDAEESAVS